MIKYTIAFAVLVASACGPPKDQLAELVEIENSQLTDVTVTATEKTSGRWLLLSGKAKVRKDLFNEVTKKQGANACGRTEEAYKAALQPAGSTTTADRIRILEPGPSPGQPVELAIELVPSQPEPAELAVNGGTIESSALTSDGWYAGASGGGFTINGEEHFTRNLGWPPEWYGKHFETAIMFDTKAFEKFCAQIP